MAIIGVAILQEVLTGSGITGGGGVHCGGNHGGGAEMEDPIVPQGLVHGAAKHVGTGLDIIPVSLDPRSQDGRHPGQLGPKGEKPLAGGRTGGGSTGPGRTGGLAMEMPGMGGVHNTAGSVSSKQPAPDSKQAGLLTGTPET